MRNSRGLVLMVSFASFALSWALAQAQERPLEYLHALQDNGYGDMAVEYLNILKNQPDLPKEIQDIWDLEMSRSLKAAASEAFDAKEYESLMEDSQKYLAKFIKEKPDHPDAMVAMASWGSFLMKKALESLRDAKLSEGKDAEQRKKSLADARAGLLDAREKLQQAEKKFQETIAALPPPSKLPTRKPERGITSESRERLLSDLSEVELQLALVEYYLAETYEDPKNPERIEAMKKAAKSFDDIFQRNRGTITGLYAHMWHGKTVEDLGDFQLALDIYDEVLANAPDPKERGSATGLEPLFAQVEQFRLSIVAKQKPDEFLPEASEWLRDYRRLRQTDGYQGILLETAKAKLAAADKAAGPDKAKILSETLQLVTDGAKVRSQYQQELVLMRQNVLKLVGRDVEVGSFDEAVAIGDNFASNSEWGKAVEAYQKALDMAEKSKLNNPKGIAEVREAMGRVQFMIAYDLFKQGKLNECFELVKEIVRDEEGNVKKESAAAAQASALGVTAALNLYVAAPEDKKAAALDTLTKVASFTETNWPDRPEADDARMARGQAKLVVGNYREALDIFERVNPKSERYPTAMYMAGQNYWRLYLMERQKPDSKINKDQMAKDHDQALDRLNKALEVLKPKIEPGKPLPDRLFDTQLLLAEIHNNDGNYKEAVALYQPLVDVIKTEKPEQFDTNTVRVFLGAVRAYCALNDLTKAGEVSDVLTTIGPDNLQINDVLVEFSKLLNLERKKALADVTSLEDTANLDELAAARARLTSTQELLGKILQKLSQRQELKLSHMMFIGSTLNSLDMTEEAKGQFEKILQRADADPAFREQAQKAMSLIRTELLKALRKQEQFDEALRQVDQLIKENPRALEPLMEKGRILEAWAEKNPAKFDAAVGHWAMLRTRLSAMRKKPDEYYDVMYNVAKCLVREAEKSKDKAVKVDRALKAEQVLKSALILNPKLNGPDTVAQYKVLVDKAVSLQGRAPQKDPPKP